MEPTPASSPLSTGISQGGFRSTGSTARLGGLRRSVTNGKSNIYQNSRNRPGSTIIGTILCSVLEFESPELFLHGGWRFRHNRQIFRSHPSLGQICELQVPGLVQLQKLQDKPIDFVLDGQHFKTANTNPEVSLLALLPSPQMHANSINNISAFFSPASIGKVRAYYPSQQH